LGLKLKNHLLVSIIIPTHNRSSLLSRAIDSVLNQTYKNWELIIINDACSDDTIQVLEPYLNDQRIRVLHLKESVGGGSARNAGLDISNGDFIAFLDDDDQWLNNKLEEQINCFSENCVSIVSCRIRMIFKSGFQDRLRSGFVNLDRLLYSNKLGNFSTCIIKHEYLKTLRISPDLKACQDWDLWIKIMEKTSLSGFVMDKVLVVKDNAHENPRLTTNYYQANNSYLAFYHKNEHLLSSSHKAFRMSTYFSRESRQLSDFKLYLKSLCYVLKYFHKVNIYQTLSILYPYFLFGEGIKNWFKSVLFLKKQLN
tara:strand:+ start:305 stop:1237 length:933 start_codon:yes stop_codon:yes gene_type:complete